MTSDRLCLSLWTRQVGWVKADTKAIQAIDYKVVTQNSRVSVERSPGSSMWKLLIKNVKQEDAGAYMCQINTDPMKSQVPLIAHLLFSTQFQIHHHAIQGGLFARHGTAQHRRRRHTQRAQRRWTLGDDPQLPGHRSTFTVHHVEKRARPHRNQKRYPTTTTTTRKLDSIYYILTLILQDSCRESNQMNAMANVTHGQLCINKVTRRDMGSYLCIASNGVPPSVSKRVNLVVLCE